MRATVLFVALALAACSGEPEVERPNLLFVSIDTLRPDFLGSYGYDRPTSPVLDGFASEGVIFKDVTSASPWTLPSHASMLTGLYPSSHGVKDHDRQLTKETLATRLKKAGFETLAIVNSHNIGDRRFGLLRGFGKAHYQLETEFDPESKLITNQGKKIAKRAVQWLKERDESRPFFLFLHFYDVHTDFTPDPRWRLEFVDAYDGPLNGNTQQLVDYRSASAALEPEDVRWLEEMYDAEIRTFDEMFEVVLDYLDVSGLRENTVVAITSDHGEEYWEHEGVLHGRTYYQEVIQIPILLRGPGIPTGLEIETPVHLVDLTATLYSLLAVHPTEKLDGIDLSLAWSGGTLPDNRLLFAEADHNNVDAEGNKVADVRCMVRMGSEKLIYDELTGRKELYDLATDPGEENDLSAERTERVEWLFGELERFRKRDVYTGSRELEAMSAEDEALLQRLGY